MNSNEPQLKADVFLLHLPENIRYRQSEISRKGYDLLAYAMKSLFFYSVSPENEEWRMERGRHGKPYFVHHPEIEFNISHSGHWLAVAVAAVPIGIDIQIHSEKYSERLIKKVFSEKEAEEYHRAADAKCYFFQHWALKESFVKMTGEGITHSLRELPDRGWQMILSVDSGVSCAISANEPMSINKHWIVSLR